MAAALTTASIAQRGKSLVCLMPDRRSSSTNPTSAPSISSAAEESWVKAHNPSTTDAPRPATDSSAPRGGRDGGVASRQQPVPRVQCLSERTVDSGCQTERAAAVALLPQPVAEHRGG